MKMIDKFIIAVYSLYLCKVYGFKYIRAKSWATMVYNDWIKRSPKTDLTFKQKKWLTSNGFGFSRFYMLKLNEENVSDYLSDFDYWRIMPLDNDYYKWVNDKLTMRYILSPFKEFLPEYYAIIDRRGRLSILPDSPIKFKDKSRYFEELVKEKGIVAMKPNAGAEGKGFIKFTFENGRYFFNDKEQTKEDLVDFFGEIKDYIITEYVFQCDEHALVCSLSQCTLRINSIMEDGEEPYLMHSFARFGTEKSGAVSNLMAGGVSMGYDSYTGSYSGKYLSASNQNIAFFDEHPESHISLVGKKLPNYEIVRDKLIEIHKYLSPIPYMGFDVIVTNSGFKICEINSAPSVSYGQMMCYPIYKNKITAAFFDKRLKGNRRNAK